MLKTLLSSSALLPYKIGIVLLLLAGAFWLVFSMGADSRQDEVDEGVQKLAKCEAATVLQNDAITAWQAAAVAQQAIADEAEIASKKAGEASREKVRVLMAKKVPDTCPAQINFLRDAATGGSQW